MKDHDKRRRSSREESTEAILDAAEELFAERGYTAVTVREIAAAAGVSHALVHRYLGSKEQVYRETLLRNEGKVLAAAGGREDLLEATRLVLREAVLDQSRYLRLITHSALHGLPYERTSGRFVATERLIELARRAAAAGAATERAADGAAADQPDAVDPRFLIASLVAMLLGWTAARDWLLPASGLQGMSEDEFLAALERLVLDVERLYLPAAGSVEAG